LNLTNNMMKFHCNILYYYHLGQVLRLISINYIQLML